MEEQRLPTRDFAHGDWVEWTTDHGDEVEGMFVEKTDAYLLPNEPICLVRVSKDHYAHVERRRLNYVPCKHGG